jgi:hypothetical protein
MIFWLIVLEPKLASNYPDIIQTEKKGKHALFERKCITQVTRPQEKKFFQEFFCKQGTLQFFCKQGTLQFFCKQRTLQFLW